MARGGICGGTRHRVSCYVWLDARLTCLIGEIKALKLAVIDSENFSGRSRHIQLFHDKPTWSAFINHKTYYVNVFDTFTNYSSWFLMEDGRRRAVVVFGCPALRRTLPSSGLVW